MTEEQKKQYIKQRKAAWRKRNPYKVAGQAMRCQARSKERYGRYQRALIETYLADTGSTRKELAAELGVAYATVGAWANGVIHLSDKHTTGDTRFGRWCRKYADRVKEGVKAHDGDRP